nr:hypothetical protein [Bacillus licheniformis]
MMAEIEEIKKDLMDAMPQEEEGPEIFEVHDLETATEAQDVLLTSKESRLK